MSFGEFLVCWCVVKKIGKLFLPPKVCSITMFGVLAQKTLVIITTPLLYRYEKNRGVPSREAFFLTNTPNPMKSTCLGDYFFYQNLPTHQIK